MNEMLQWVRATLPMELDWPRMIEDKIESLIEKEKEQIKNANMDGYKEGCTYHSFDHRPKTTEQYYNQTYNQNK